MELSSSLLKEFAEETNDSEEVTSRSTAYGTIVRSGARTYVQLDGSDQLTAITEGTNVEAGDRVIVTIENHTATVTTNLSVPATGRITETMVEEGMIYGYFDVLEAQFASIENLEANYITAKEINAEYASFTYLAAEYASFEQLEAAFASFDYVVTGRIDAEVANINEAFIGYAQIIDADIQNLYAATATIDDLTATVAKISEAYISYEEVQRLLADYATISRLEAETAEIQTAFIEYAGITTADIEELFADLAVIQETYITQATINELLAGYATISDLQVTYANIETLDASIANISNVLAGNVGTGDLQTIYLTSDNAVIDSAVIVDALIGTVLADVIKSNTIYTDQITIMSEDGGIYIVGNQMRFSNGQIQFYDDNGVCRLQIGQDTSGNFTFVLYDETGTGIMIDSEGIHESAVPDGLIVDSMVAEDANIAASKIDMADVISYINDSGDLTMDAYQIYIDGERLDYKLTTITESAVTEVINYYALGPSPYEPPCDPDDSNIVDAICGIAICGLSYTSTVGWTTTPLYSEEEGLYVWYVQKKIYIDGSYSWTEPTCLTDQYTRTKTSTMMTELEVVQGEIAARIWQTDIEEATGVLGDQIITITDSYSELTVTVDEIEERVASLTTSYGENFEYLYSQMAEITVQLGEIDLGVSQSISYIYDELESISSEGIKSRTAYFAVSYSPDYYPDLSGDLTYSSVCGIAICGLAVVGNSGYWTTEQPTLSDGEYVWITWLVETIDGETYWEDPILLTDYLAREQISYMSSQISGMQILIDEIDIGIQNVYSYVDNEIEIVNERTAEIVLTLDEIDLGLKSLESVETEHYNYLYDQYTGISMELGSITARVEEVASESGEAIKNRTAYFAVSYSADYYPTLPSLTNGSPDLIVSVYTAITGLAICGLAIAGNTGYWTKDQPIPEEGQYVWISYLVETISGEVYWEDPILLSDEAARKEISYMSERYAEVAVTLDSINLEIYSLHSDLDGFSEQITQIDMKLNSMILTVYDSGNGMASIQMIVGDEVTSAVDVVTEASKAFEHEINSNSSITISAGYVAFISNTLVIESSQISLDLEGNLTISTPQFTLDANGNATFSGSLNAASGTFSGTLDAADGTFSGTIYAAAGGTIGGFTIGSNSLYTNNNTLGSGSNNVYIGNDGISLGTTFEVNRSGYLTCTSGKIGGFYIGSSSLYNGPSSISSSTTGICIETDGIRINASDGSYILLDQAHMCRVGSDNCSVSISNSGSTMWGYQSYSSGKMEYYVDVNFGFFGGHYTSATNEIESFALRSQTNGGALDICNSSGTTSIGLVGSSGNINASGRLTLETTNSTGIYYDYTGSSGACRIRLCQEWSGRDISLEIGSGGANRGIYDEDEDEWIFYKDTYSYVHVIGSGGRVYIEGTAWAPDNSAYFSEFRAYDDIYISTSGDSYANPSSASPNVRLANGSSWSRLCLTTGSSIRYKNLVQDVSNSDVSKLFEIPVIWFKYKDDYLSDEDERYEKEIPGFVTENWEDVLPIAVDHNVDGSPEMWNSNIVIPLTFAMVKYNHELILNVEDSIDNLQLQIDDLKAENKALKEELAAIKAA